jgi:hypothetical protein
MNLLRLVSVSLSAAAALAGLFACDSARPSGDGHATGAAAPTPDLQSVHSSVPAYLACDGVQGAADAAGLVVGGEAVAAVLVTIDEPAGRARFSTRWVPVAAYTVVAGSLDSRLSEVEEFVASGQDESTLPPGEYLLLLGSAEAPGRYFLSDGLAGSFAVEGDEAFERCPNPDSPGSPRLVRDGVTDIAILASLFDQAMRPEVQEAG